ncbi:MAG: CCA tRNA nucleotidyltransferase [Proteobacteria bacterium]|nr:CCA tRNA nucleotidyltransferase [Pseudomonadota bacterium]
MDHTKEEEFTKDEPILAARIIPSEEHNITPELIDRDALFILKKLAGAGYAGYLVGGGVRDLYLGKTPKDFDISTDARPGQLRKLFPHSNTIGRRFRLVQVFFKAGKTIEISTLRSLSEHDIDGPQEVLAPNNTFGTLSEDARRRDLTINSLFYEIITGTIIDYVGGTEDLDRGIIRIGGEPARRIGRDPVRMMRAIRHAARNNFSIEAGTWKAICAHSNELSLCPPSRLRDEFLKDLYGGAAHPWFLLAVDSGIFTNLFPFYSIILMNQDNFDQRKVLLENIFHTIDRANSLAVQQNIHRQPDFFLFAFILVPWVEARWQLFSEFRKSSVLFQLANQIRDEVDRSIGIRLNLRRSLRQDMVGLLINLSLLIHNKTPSGWPKWLKRKSYFRKATLFYHFYTEALTGEAIADEVLITDTPPRPLESLQPSPGRATPEEEKHSPSKCKPAFSSNTKGGIFGFKR